MVRETVIQTLLSVAVLLFSLLVGFVGVGFLVAGLYLALETWLPPAGAAATTGFILLLTALIMVLSCRAALSRTPTPEAQPDSIADLLKDAESMSRMTRHLEGTLKRHFPIAAGSAFAAGFYLGVNPDARHALGRALADMKFEDLGATAKGATSGQDKPGK